MRSRVTSRRSRVPEEQPDHDILTFGGIALIRSLMTVGLIDEFRLQVHPVLAGSGTCLFGYAVCRRS